MASSSAMPRALGVPNWVIGGALLGFCGAVYMHTVNQIKTTSGLIADVEEAAKAMEKQCDEKK